MQGEFYCFHETVTLPFRLYGLCYQNIQPHFDLLFYGFFVVKSSLFKSLYIFLFCFNCLADFPFVIHMFFIHSHFILFYFVLNKLRFVQLLLFFFFLSVLSLRNKMRKNVVALVKRKRFAFRKYFSFRLTLTFALSEPSGNAFRFERKNFETQSKML